MNHQSFTQRFFRYVPALFTLTALALAGWAVVDRPAPSTTAAAVSLTTTSAADGTLPAAGADVRRRIEDVRVGDLVWAYDEQTGQLEKRQVTALFRSQTDHLRVLTLESGSGERQRIETTDEHPFWVVGYGWQDAQLLRPGDRLLEPDQSHVTVIASVREEHPDGLTVYNFEVAGLHDYFVSATATDSLVLSHNMCGNGGGASKATINPQKQAGHIPGTPQQINRVKQGKPTSTFLGERSGEMATQIANQRGTPVPGRPNIKEYDFGVGVGTGPNGGTQTRVRVHTSPTTGQIHGHPSGPERF